MSKTIQDLYEEARNERDFIMKCSKLPNTVGPMQIIDLALCAETSISPRKGLDYPVCTKVECNSLDKLSPKKMKKKEQTMNLYDDEDDMDTDNKVTYLQSRLNSVRYRRENELEMSYGLRDADRPMTFNDFLARITSGKYTIDEKNKDRNCYSPLDYVRWRDPAVKEDPEGYKKAHVALNKAATEAMDTIVVMSDDAARLAAIRDFEKAAATIQ